MCGIAGIIQNASIRTPGHLNRDIHAMTNAIRHRGPDDEGFFHSPGNRCVLGNRRLSILDLSSHGHMPMTTDDGRLTITYNGEVYNYPELRRELSLMGYSFISNTDTEVVLKAYHAWGRDCLERFNGMFAFAIWDEFRKQLFLARDRFGIKPLYYSATSKILAFASEIKSLLQLPYLGIGPNVRAMTDFLEHAYSAGTRETFFEPVYRLEAAHFCLLDLCDGISVEPKRYWDIQQKSSKVPFKEFDEVREEFKTLLTESIRLQMRSDVPLGVCLSGGLDSSTIVGLLSKELGLPVRTFSSYFPEDGFDESTHFRSVAAHFRTEAHEVLPASDFLPQKLSRVLWHIEEPSPHYGIIPQWHVIELAKEKVKVLLNGQGGDESLAGYYSYLPAFLGTKLKELVKRPTPLAILSFYREKIAAEMLAGRKFTSELRKLLMTKTNGNSPLFRPHNTVLVPDDYYQQFSSYPNEKFAFDHYDLDAMLYAHLTRNSLPGLLRDEDKISMAFSIESRVPFLDHRLIEFLFTLDSSYKIKMGWNKYLLRQDMSDILPPDVTWRRDKKGYPTPLKLWFSSDTHPAYTLLSELNPKQRPWFNPDKLEKLKNEHKAGMHDHTRPLWRAVAVESWFRTFWGNEIS